MESVLILDNGAHTIKAAWSTSTVAPRLFRNAITKSKSEKKTYIADELDQCPDYGGLTFKIPFERGILNNWDAQKTIWDRVFSQEGMQIKPETTNLVITEPVFNLPNVQEAYDQMLFEEYDFNSVLRVPGPALIQFGPCARGEAQVVPECILVIDSGYSFTHIVPVIRGSIVSAGVRRVDIGGKLLTNHLKELVSFRQWYMMDQTSVIEKVKETCCYVSQQWNQDWETANSSTTNSIVRTYVLPDFIPTSTNKLGFVKPLSTGLTPPPSPVAVIEPIAPSYDSKGKVKVVVEEEEQLLQMSNERFTVPEILFNPSTLGLNQAGIAEAVMQSIASLPLELQGMFWSNVVCVGGNCAFAGFEGRLTSELRSLCPLEFSVDVTLSTSPTLESLLSASSALTLDGTLAQRFVTREEYQESGVNASKRKLASLYWDSADLARETY